MHLRDLTQFLYELEQNNNRAWFVMNKPRYDILRAEFLELVIELVAGITRFDAAMEGCSPKKALFRINRDLRFRPGGEPYKTTFSAAMTATGIKSSAGGGPFYYFQLNARGDLFTAGGEYAPPAGRLREIRQHIVGEPKALNAVLKDKGLLTVFGGLQEQDKLVRPPKGFDTDEPHIEQLKLKSFVVRKIVSTAKIIGPDLPALILADFAAAQPLVKWLRNAGPSQDKTGNS